MLNKTLNFEAKTFDKHFRNQDKGVGENKQINLFVFFSVLKFKI